MRTAYYINPLPNMVPQLNGGTGTNGNANLQHTRVDYCGNLVYENDTLKQVLIDGGYVTFNGSSPQYHFYVQDHLGNNRVVCNASGTIEQVNHYYPFGGLMGESTNDEVQRYKYNGKELDRMHGLNLYDYHARQYDGVRFTTMDPLAEKYYNVSPYAYCAGNPVMYVDPDGALCSPIYDFDGKFLGTDDEGLQGEAIIMNKKDFKQGMSHSDALSKNEGFNRLQLQKAKINFYSHFSNLPNRPDYDGKLTLEEANNWFREGTGEPLYVSLEKIDLSGIASLGEAYVGQVKSFNLLLNSCSLNDGLVYGNITLKRYPNHTVRAYSDKYDFEMHNPMNPLNWGRNIETIIGRKVAGKGRPFEINIYGSKKITPIFPWIK